MRLQLAVLLLALPTALHAGPIFVPGHVDAARAYHRGKAPRCQYALRFSTIDASVDGQTATVSLVDRVRATSAQQAACLIPLPAGAKASGWSVTLRAGREAPSAAPGAHYLDAEQARTLYERLARELTAPGLLALGGRPALLVPRMQLEGSMTLQVRYRQSVATQQGVRWLRCPMPVAGWSSGKVGRVRLRATLADGQPIRGVFSPTHDIAIRRDGPKATVRMQVADWCGSDDFQLGWVADDSPLGLRMITYREPGQSQGYFMLLANPSGGETRPVAKDVTFVVDASGSMRGEKIEQARAAVEQCIERLQPGDRFNIVTFGSEVRRLADAPLSRSRESLERARRFVEQTTASGRTNLSGALDSSLAGPAAGKRPRMMLLLTDGAPTVGELDPDKILTRTKKRAGGTQIFVVGLGDDVNAHLLDGLAEATRGDVEYLSADEEIDAKVAGLYERLSHPVLTDVSLALGELRATEVYPRKMPDLFRGAPLMVFGRFRGKGPQTLTVGGTLHGVERSFATTVDVPEKADGAAFVATLWASRTVGFLLQQIRLHGENDELLKEVVRLSRKFGIVTEYTEFLASAGGGRMDAKKAMAEAKHRMRSAYRAQTGSWAVNQARNDKSLQRRTIATNESNEYTDRRGEVVNAGARIQQIGRRVFYLRSGQWVDAEEAGKRKVRTVELYSKAYWKLVREHPSFAKAQKLSWAMAVNVGDERIVVSKKGKTKDPALGGAESQQGAHKGRVRNFDNVDNNNLLRRPNGLRQPNGRKNR